MEKSGAIHTFSRVTSILGIVMVFDCIAGRYLVEHGKLPVWIQPAELVIILVRRRAPLSPRNPVPALIRTWKAAAGILSGSPYAKRFYAESLHVIYDLISSARKMGTGKLEAEVEDPSKSDVFKYPKFLK